MSLKVFSSALFFGAGLFGAANPAFAIEIKDIHALPRAQEVFAYARISPSGRFLVYASYPPAGTDPRAMRALPQPSPAANDTSNFRHTAFIPIEIMKVIDLATNRVLFDVPGIDGFWSNDEQRLIYYSDPKSDDRAVAIWHRKSGAAQRNVAPTALGSYYSWGVRNGQNLILTILNNYFFLDGKGAAILPASHVVECPELGPAERPLLSRDGQRISVFVGGTLVVRDLTGCEHIVNTGVPGAKADFSWDNRYLAFHAPKTDARQGYEIKIVDLKRRTVRSLSGFKGSSFFPSWTRDGRLSFRYEGDDYNGFRMAKDVLSLPEQPLPPPAPISAKELKWDQLFPETPPPSSAMTLVLVWATWSPYSADALAVLEKLQTYFRRHRFNVSVATATDLTSSAQDIEQFTRRMNLTLPRIPLAPNRFILTEAVNQIPTTLMFVGDRLADRRLGAQSFEQIIEWIAQQEGQELAAIHGNDASSLD